MLKIWAKKFSGSHPPVSALPALYPCHPFAGFYLSEYQSQRSAMRSFAIALRVCIGRFLTFWMFHACSYLKIKKLSVKIHCSTQQFLTPRKGINISAYLQALQRVYVWILFFSLSGCLCGVCGLSECVLCRCLSSHADPPLSTVKIFYNSAALFEA